MRLLAPTDKSTGDDGMICVSLAARGGTGIGAGV